MDLRTGRRGSRFSNGFVVVRSASKNALFYKTLHGAPVGDLFMALIHTCELNDANPFDYLTELQWHDKQLRQAPQRGCTKIIVSCCKQKHNCPLHRRCRFSARSGTRVQNFLVYFAATQACRKDTVLSLPSHSIC